MGAGHARALCLGLAESPSWAEERAEHDFMVGGDKPEDRLVNFLKELIFLLETRQAVAEELEFEPENEACWRVRGSFARVLPEDVVREIKSPTYHRLHVESSPDWRAEIYFDL